MDSLFPFLQGLAPLQHGGLARRTAVDRLTGNNPEGIPLRGEPPGLPTAQGGEQRIREVSATLQWEPAFDRKKQGATLVIALASDRL